MFVQHINIIFLSVKIPISEKEFLLSSAVSEQFVGIKLNSRMGYCYFQLGNTIKYTQSFSLREKPDEWAIMPFYYSRNVKNLCDDFSLFYNLLVKKIPLKEQVVFH